MITLKYDSLKNHNMTNAIHKLGQHPKFAPKLALSVANLIDEIQKQEKAIHDEWSALIMANAVLDEKGEFKPRENHNGDPIPNSFIPKDQEKWDKIVEEFDGKSFKVNADRIAMDDLAQVGLSPYEIKQLQPLIAEKILSLAK